MTAYSTGSGQLQRLGSGPVTGPTSVSLEMPSLRQTTGRSTEASTCLDIVQP